MSSISRGIGRPPGNACLMPLLFPLCRFRLPLNLTLIQPIESFCAFDSRARSAATVSEPLFSLSNSALCRFVSA
eukprot:5799412-Pleurochrysis_carterae.AAC.1